MTNKEISNIIIRDILMEAVEDDWGTSLAHRISNDSVMDGLTDEEKDDIISHIDAIAFDVRDAIYKLHDFLKSVGC
jgi:hypothetical protein